MGGAGLEIIPKTMRKPQDAASRCNFVGNDDSDWRLSLLIERWPELPEATREAIIDLVQS